MVDTNLLKKAGIGAIGIAAAGAGTYYYGNQIELFNFKVVEFDLTLPRLAASFEGYRIAHISDLHHDGDFMNRDHFTRAVNVLNKQNADIVLITGDFVSREIDEDNRQSLIDNLRAIKSYDGVFAVMGNHDYKANIAELRDILATSGITDLSNNVYTLERDGALLNIAGVDDVTEQLADINAVIDRLPDATSPTILLAHEPDYADISAATGRFDLQLSGHSHGGQIRMPLLGAVYLPELGKKYPDGLYQINNMLLYTNRGLGVVHLPVRINCPPEITVLTLRAD
jgi:hypothetical protein